MDADQVEEHKRIFVECNSVGETLPPTQGSLDQPVLSRFDYDTFLATRWLPIIYGEEVAAPKLQVDPDWEQAVKNRVNDNLRDIFG